MAAGHYTRVDVVWVVVLLLCLIIIIAPSSCFGQSTNTASTLAQDPRLSKFVEFFVEQIGIPPGCGGSGSPTILAPTNDAWIIFEQNDIDRWMKYSSQPEYIVHLRDLLFWHCLRWEKLTLEEIFDGRRTYLENLIGNITVNQELQKIDNVPATSIVQSNIETTDGIIHVLDEVIVPPHLGMNLMEQLFNGRSNTFALSTMANLALFSGLEEQINGIFEHGITVLVPPNRRFHQAGIDINALLTDEMKPYTRNFVLCHMIKDIYHQAGVFEMMSKENTTTEKLITSELGTHMWITTTQQQLRFQSREILVPDQVSYNGIFHIMNYPLTPPMASDFAYFMPISTSHDTTACFDLFRQTLLSSMDISVMFNSSITLWCPTTEAFEFFNREDWNRLLDPSWVRHATEFLLNHMSAPAMSRAELVALAPSFITMLNGATYELHKSGIYPRIKNGANEQGRSEFGDLISIDGYLHLLDAVITPTAFSRGIYEQSNANPDFSELIKNIDFVDLKSIVDRDLPLTMLAPDNNAWGRDIFDTFEGSDIIKRHIFRGLLFTDVIANASQITAVNGVTLEVELRGDFNEYLFVGGAYIYQGDILARNGVLHYIDRVIGIPYPTSEPTDSPAPTATPGPSLWPTQTPTLRPTNSPTDSLEPSSQPSIFVPVEISVSVEFSLAIADGEDHNGVTPESLVVILEESLDSLASQVLLEIGGTEKIIVRKLGTIGVQQTSIASWDEVVCPTESMVNNNYLCLDIIANLTVVAENGLVDSTTTDKYEEFSSAFNVAVEDGRLDETLHSLNPELPPVLVFTDDELPPTLEPTTPRPSTFPSFLPSTATSNSPSACDVSVGLPHFYLISILGLIYVICIF